MISGQTSLFSYRPGALLRVTGDDAFTFLQGQFTNELRQAPGSATYGLWLNQKGKILADSHVLRISEKEFLVVSTGSTAALIRQRLEDYIVADDVTLADETDNTHGLLLSGADSTPMFEQVWGGRLAPGNFARNAEILAFCGRRVPEENFEILGAAKPLEDLRQRLLAAGGVEIAAGDMEFARISAGIPAVPADLGPGDLPNEGGLEDSAISYTKGCYLGQEVMARLKNLGQVRRRLHVVRGHGAAPASAAALYQGEKKVGEVRSTASRSDEFAALAMLSLINLKPKEPVGLDPTGPASIRVDPHG